MVKKNVLVHRAGVVLVGETSGFVDPAAQQRHPKPRSISLPSCPQGSPSPLHGGRVTAIAFGATRPHTLIW